MKTVLTWRGLVPIALAAALLSGSALAQTAVAPTTAVPEPNIPLSRDEVMRDLAAWKQSGVERSWSSDNSPDITSPEYIANYRKYMDTVRPGSAAPPMQTQSQNQGKW